MVTQILRDHENSILNSFQLNSFVMGCLNLSYIFSSGILQPNNAVTAADIGAIADVNDVIREMIEILRQRSSSERIDP